jgi:hypothetical protein
MATRLRTYAALEGEAVADLTAITVLANAFASRAGLEKDGA